MIYRKWSLLSSTAVITTGIVGAFVLGNLLFVNQVSHFNFDGCYTILDWVVSIDQLRNNFH